MEQGGEYHVSALLRAEQSAAPDCLQRPLLRRSRFRQQVSSAVRFPGRRWGAPPARRVGCVSTHRPLLNS